ncbi:MAG: acyl-protein synthetase, partial [Christensenellaceae bacterium]
FLEKHKGETIFLFGFTFMIWEHLYKKLHKTGRSLDFSHGIMLHGGGFKKLAAEAVDNETYKKRLYEVCGITDIYNYYGMVEQTGSIFMECEHGRLHASVFSDVIIRNPLDFSVCTSGEQGLIQLVSLLPKSYPGHSILSEDIGEIIGEDDCPCGRLGKTFKIHGRIQNAEVRGCSDTYEKK